MNYKPLSREFLLARGKCCKNSCAFCPYKNKNMNIKIFTIAYNEEIMLPYFIKWYRERFPNCSIVVYDNYSTDNTRQIALDNNCEVIQYDTGDKLSDSTYLQIKNNCWKDAITDWVLVCDVDEMLDINEKQLNVEQKLGNTIISSKGYNMYNIVDTNKVEDMFYGVRAKQYDKYYLFNKNKIQDINYSAGCHIANPVGEVELSNNKYNLLHFSYLSAEYIIKRYKQNASRLSDENKKNNWGIHYNESEQTIIDKFEVAKNYYNNNKQNFNKEEILIWK